MDDAEFQKFVAMIAALEPPSGHTFDVPSVPAVPTQDDVVRATERLIELEDIAAAIPDKIRYVDLLTSQLSYTYNANEATPEQYGAYWESMDTAQAVRESWVDEQALVAQQIAHWQTAVAVMEHDIAWQQATSGTRSAAPRTRPLPADAVASACVMRGVA